MKRVLSIAILLLLVCSSCLQKEQIPSPLTSIDNTVPSPVVYLPTRTPFVYPTPAPTLAIELQEQLYENLKTNGNCELPCFLGIAPGESSHDDAESFSETYAYDHKMLPYRVDLAAPYQWYTSEFYIDKKGDQISFSLYLQSIKGIVSGLIVNFGPVLNFEADSEYDKNKHLERYGILELFQRYGTPTEIYLNPPRIHDTLSAYTVEVVYNDKKILARYSGIATLAESSKYQLCPAIGDGDVGSFMIALADPLDSHLNILEFAWGSFNKDFDLSSYSDVIKLDPQQVYSLFMQKNERCFYEDEYRVE